MTKSSIATWPRLSLHRAHRTRNSSRSRRGKRDSYLERGRGADLWGQERVTWGGVKGEQVGWLAPLQGLARPGVELGGDGCDTSVDVAAIVNRTIAVNLVSGVNYPDGMSMSSVADGSATLETESSTSYALCSSADIWLANFGTRVRSRGLTPVVRIAGGTAAVSTAVENEVKHDVCQATLNCTVRYAGADRYQTSLLIANSLEAGDHNFVVATGLNWTDGVPGGQLAARLGSPLLLLDNSSAATRSYIQANIVTSPNGTASLAYVLGTTTGEPLSNLQYVASLLPTPPAGGPAASDVLSSIRVDDQSSRTTAGNPIQIYGCNGSAAQAIYFASDETIRILGGCLDTQYNGSANMLIWNTCNGTATQDWLTDWTNDALINLGDNECLDDPARSTSWGTQLWVYSCNNTVAQNWLLP